MSTSRSNQLELPVIVLAIASTYSIDLNLIQLKLRFLKYITTFWIWTVFLYRLSGLSPFAGEDDLETLANVQRCDWEFAEDAFTHISPEAKDFIRQLLIRQPQYVIFIN